MDTLQMAAMAVKRYAESHPRPIHINQKQAALMLNLSVPTIRKLVACGTLKLNKFGLIPISEIDSALMAGAG